MELRAVLSLLLSSWGLPSARFTLLFQSPDCARMHLRKLSNGHMILAVEFMLHHMSRVYTVSAACCSLAPFLVVISLCQTKATTPEETPQNEGTAIEVKLYTIAELVITKHYLSTAEEKFERTRTTLRNDIDSNKEPPPSKPTGYPQTRLKRLSSRKQ